MTKKNESPKTSRLADYKRGLPYDVKSALELAASHDLDSVIIIGDRAAAERGPEFLVILGNNRPWDHPQTMEAINWGLDRVKNSLLDGEMFQPRQPEPESE